MDSERMRKIEAYGNAYTELVSGIEQFPREMWQWKPTPDGWSIHETIIHITDSEANSYIRCRRFLAEPGSSVMVYDEGRWATELRYQKQNTEEALELFRCLPRNSYNLIRSLPETVWANTVFHPENGTM